MATKFGRCITTLPALSVARVGRQTMRDSRSEENEETATIAKGHNGIIRVSSRK